MTVVLLSVIVGLLCQSIPGDALQMTVTMPGAVARTDDAYLCTAKRIAGSDVTDNLYITGFSTKASMHIAHHILVYGCLEPLNSDPSYYYDCAGICKGGTHIMYAWARDAPGLQLPQDTGFPVAGHTDIAYLVMQVHYLSKHTNPDYSSVTFDLTTKPQTYSAGIFLMLAPSGTIPPKKTHYSLDVSCKYSGGVRIEPFAFRTHAHTLARTIVAYRLSPDLSEIQEIGRGNPQWAQAFYPANKGVVIKDGDYLAARCVYDSMDLDRNVYIGGTHMDEMCNFYIMYAMSSTLRTTGSMSCAGMGASPVWSKIPSDSLDYMPSKPNFSVHVKDHHSEHTMAKTRSKGLTKPVQHDKQLGPVRKVQNWPKLGHLSGRLGQISGVGVDSKDHVFLFHRGSRSWTGNTFTASSVLVDKTPIKEDTIIELDPSGTVVSSWGSDLFYLPHSLRVDSHGCFWITDVGAHQVYKYSADHKLLLTLGTKLTPGFGAEGFCQPADVITNDKGEIFVADGYCNARVAKFDSSGKYLTQFVSKKSKLDVAHALAVIESENLVCVANREKALIECFDMDSGVSKRVISSERFGEAVYAIAYSPQLHQLYAVNSASSRDSSLLATGFTVDFTTASVSQVWGSFRRPHSLALSANGQYLYVSEIGPNMVYKFEITEMTAFLHQHPQEHAHPHKKSSHTAVTYKESHISAEDLALVKDTRASFMIGLFLVVPVVLILMIVGLVKLKRAGRLPCCPQTVKNRRYGPMFRDREGFEPLNQDESDIEENPTSPLTADPSAKVKA